LSQPAGNLYFADIVRLLVKSADSAIKILSPGLTFQQLWLLWQERADLLYNEHEIEKEVRGISGGTSADTLRKPGISYDKSSVL
jgi:hypothetical protein